MNNTALGAVSNKKENIRFISEAHEKFYYEKLKEVRYVDVYHKALCYCLGISDDTRRNINRIYDFKTGCVKPECLHDGWQTSGSEKVVRMAFNLYCNGTPSVDDEQDAEEQIDECRRYSAEDLFCCCYAPFFWQAIQIRYPEYANYNHALYAMFGGNEDSIYIAGIQVDINPITEGRTGTLETYLPEVETYLQEKAQQEQINNQLITQGRENALEQQSEKEKIAEENIISELEKEPVIEPETVHITFTVAECGEFHTMGEFHEGIETIEKAMKLYNAIAPSHMHGIPSIGVNMHIDGTEEWEDEEADIVRGNCIDVDFLNYTPELRDTPTVQDALKKLIVAYPDKEVNDRETKETKIQTLAAELDQLSYEIDTFEYRDSVPDREAQVQMIANGIRSGNVKPLQIFLQTSIDEGIDEDSERQAKELIAKLAEYKPLAKIEELEEQNYNMIDDRLNNGVEKFNREEEKKEQQEKPQARSSLKERLVAKQKKVAQGKNKDVKEQDKTKKTNREEI